METKNAENLFKIAKGIFSTEQKQVLQGRNILTGIYSLTFDTLGTDYRQYYFESAEIFQDFLRGQGLHVSKSPPVYWAIQQLQNTVWMEVTPLDGVVLYNMDKKTAEKAWDKLKGTSGQYRLISYTDISVLVDVVKRN